MKIKIIGGGSAGNHMAFALSKLKDVKQIYISDLNKDILGRSKKIFISRYKKLNNKINYIIENNDFKSDIYDAIVVSTPPAYHKINIEKNLKKSDFFLIEKPLCDPSSSSINYFNNLDKKYKNKTFLCGYNHRLFPSTIKLKHLIKNEKIKFCRVSFKENITGFLRAHNWLSSINQTYLSKTNKGGGALCEHSHAINLLQFLMDDKIDSFRRKSFSFTKDKKNFHDTNFKGMLYSKNFIGEFEQNFETLPIEKTVELFTNNKIFKLTYNYKNSSDCIEILNSNKIYTKEIFKKERSDDFLFEAKHLIKKIKYKNKIISNIELKSSLLTIKIIKKLLKNLI